jgi:hypothetical protein
VLLNAATTNDEKRFANLEKKVTNLQDTNVELVSTIGEMRENQSCDQTKMIALQMELEATNRKSDIATNKLKKCKSAISNVETRLASLSMKEDTNKQFDRIESLITGAFGGKEAPSNNEVGKLAGKRKEQSEQLEHEGDSSEEELLAIQDGMETKDVDETNKSNNKGSDGSDNQTNSQSVNKEQSNMQLK